MKKRRVRRPSRIEDRVIAHKTPSILDPRSWFRQRDLVAIDFGVDPGRQKAEAQAARAPSYGLSPPLLAVDAAKDAFAQAEHAVEDHSPGEYVDGAFG